MCGRKCLVDVRGQRRTGRLVRDDRKATVTQITTRYNQDLQNTISEHTTHRTLKQMDSSSRRPHRVPLRSDKNRTRRIQLTQTHQNQTIEDCKNVAWSDESRFLLRHSDVGSEFGVKNMKAWIILPCLNGSGWCWWCNGVGGFSWHTLGPLVPIEHRLNATAYLSIVADHVHPFMTTVYPSSDEYFQQDNAPCHKAQIISDWFLEHYNFTEMTSTVTRSQSNRAPLGCGGTGDSHHGCENTVKGVIYSPSYVFQIVVVCHLPLLVTQNRPSRWEILALKSHSPLILWVCLYCYLIYITPLASWLLKDAQMTLAACTTPS